MPDSWHFQQIKYSVSTRVFIGLSLIIAVFASLIIYAMVLYKRSVAEMYLINTAYVPLTLGTAEIQSAQVIFNTLTDRLAEEPNQQITRDWLNAARKYRPATLTRLIHLITGTLADSQPLPHSEVLFLKELRKRLRDVRRRYRMNENKFATLFAMMDMGRTEQILLKLESLKRSERLLNNVLAGIGGDVRAHIVEVSTAAIKKGNTATMILGIMGIIALIIGIGVTISTKKLLSPLKRLHQAVSTVAQGNFELISDIDKHNEIGSLATNFNHMIHALQIRDKKLRISERLATAGKIAAQVTHEIRNPLSSLGLNADLLMDELDTVKAPLEAKNLLIAMQDEIERLTRITEAYLLFARLPTPQKKLFSINRLVQETADFMNSQIEDAGCTVTVELDDSISRTLFDREQLRQVLVNLIQNAIQAMPDGGEISIKTDCMQKNILLTVCDTGPGISPEMEPGIFDPFFTTKSTGTGLGLAMVRQICNAHKGTINFKNRETGGTCFIVTLPA
jgi:signal transduction histidine kinase